MKGCHLKEAMINVSLEQCTMSNWKTVSNSRTVQKNRKFANHTLYALQREIHLNRPTLTYPIMDPYYILVPLYVAVQIVQRVFRKLPNDLH